ncbi:MAG: hypothetical protein K6T91_10480 [Firmicutes bacterium]|nr:hypothetical protein [Bacillota bacterium]
MGLDLLERLSIAEYVEPWPAELIDIMVPELKVIYSDVDGTLLGPGGCLFMDANHQFTSIPAQAILECHMHRIDVVLISGRNRHQLHSDARILGFKNWIAELGCQLVYNMGEIVVLNVGDFPAEENNVWKEIQKSGAPELLLNKFKGLLEYHYPWSENRECTHLLRGSIDVEAANAFLQDAGFEQLKIIDNGPVRRRSENLSPDILRIHAYHLLPKASGKASAVRKDRETREIPRNMCAAIGDSVADLELAPEVGVLFLVRNAVLEDPEIMNKIHEFGNVFITRESMGLGWAEAVGFLIRRLYR